MNAAVAFIHPHDNGFTAEESEVLEAANAILQKRFTRGQAITGGPAEVGALFLRRLAHLPREVFSAVFLDTKHRVLSVEDLFVGTVDCCEIHPREVVRRALELNASAVIFAHNHPSGDPEFSVADRALTDRLKQSLGFVDIRVLDHILIAGTNTPVSMAARGWI